VSDVNDVDSACVSKLQVPDTSNVANVLEYAKKRFGTHSTVMLLMCWNVQKGGLVLTLQ
jgi:hypothetical protein